MVRSLSVLLALALASVGCAGSSVPPDTEPELGIEWDEDAVRDHLRRLTAAVAPGDSAEAAERAVYAARRFGRFGLMPAREPSFYLRQGGTDVSFVGPTEVGPTEAHVAGYVAGRHPSRYDELVLVAADLDRPGAAAVLEAARVLAAEARYTQTPERSVLFALWAPPRTGEAGLRDFLANPTWSLKNVRRALLVTADSASAGASRRLLDARGISVDVVTVGDQGAAGAQARPEVAQARRVARTVRLADALYARIVAATMGRDSTVALP